MPYAKNKSPMDINAKKQINLHFDALPKATKKALDFLSDQSWLKNTRWYLAGGTALALQEGIRRSVDLDFFTTDSDFKMESIALHFLNDQNWKTSFGEAGTIYGELFKAKVSFIAYPFFIPKQEMIKYGSVKILQSADVAIMKIIAISQRGRKRDFFDLYWCAKNIEPLPVILRKLKKQYPSVAHDYHHILKSLIYFSDAEKDPEPEIYFRATWKDVKKFFNSEIPKIMKEIIGLDHQS